ncbi:FecR family protein [Stieleria sp. TO1_6]|uniref:FecR family protein n=1 Tax=Stieleria tagensis TaxID=2956795 RepID=UPI00209AE020|nr:FecR family protein [Stieleria tagensis]MCO8124570.1 FecR family protein [Stieleria tagensis]
MSEGRYEQLLNRLLDDELSASEVQEFQAILNSNVSLASEASQRLAEHRLLGMVHQPFDADAFSNSVMSSLTASDARTVESILSETGVSTGKKPLPSNNWTKYSTTVVLGSLAALLLLGLGLFVWSERAATRTLVQGGVSVEVPQLVVATLLLSENCAWVSGDVLQPELSEGERLKKGNLTLKSGLAVIRFDGGAEVVLQGKCSLVLLSAGSVQVDQGDVIVRAADEATGFRVQTPSSELIDLGTEFSVSVGDGGQTKLNVLEGEVSIRPRNLNASQSSLLSEGKSVVVKDAASPPQSSPHDDLRFASVIRNANPRSRPNLRFAYDGFFYDEGQVPLSESTKGKGWQGPWRKRSPQEGYREDQDTTDALSIVQGKMNVTWGVQGGQLGMLEMPAGVTVRLREMTRSIDLSKSGVYYFSLMVREPDHVKRRTRSQPRERIRLTFRSEQDYNGESLSFGIASGGKPRVLTGTGVGFVCSSKAPTNQTTLWIGKIVSRANGEDEVFYRIFGEDEELFGDQWNWAEPAEWDVASRNLDLSARLNLVVLTSEGVGTRYIDELRIGPTWRSVAPLRQ